MRLGASNWRWIQFDQSCSRGASSSGAPMTVAIVSDGYGLAKSATNSQRPASATSLPELLEEAAHRRAPAIGRARREGGVHEVAQAAVIGAVHVEDVAAHLLVERAVLHAEQLGDLHAGEGRALRAQEEASRPRDRARSSRARPWRARSARPGPPSSRGSARPCSVVSRKSNSGSVELGERGHR